MRLNRMQEQIYEENKKMYAEKLQEQRDKITRQAIKTYNTLMGNIGYEHNQIGTIYSENTENWNLRDMVAECDYTLSCYYESGHCNCDMRYSSDPEERKMWRSETGRLKRFIEKYKGEALKMECSTGHCSNYD